MKFLAKHIVTWNIEIDGLPLIGKQSVTCLGVTIDSHSKCNEHALNIHTSTSRNIGILYWFKRSFWNIYDFIISFFNMRYIIILYGAIVVYNNSFLIFCFLRSISRITNPNYWSHTEHLFHLFEENLICCITHASKSVEGMKKKKRLKEEHSGKLKTGDHLTWCLGGLLSS